MIQQDRLQGGVPRTVLISQQDDPVRAGTTGPDSTHNKTGNAVFECLYIRIRRVALGDQHITIGQGIKPARVVQLGGKRGNGKPRSRGGVLSTCPANRMGNIDRGKNPPGRCRQHRGRPRTCATSSRARSMREYCTTPPAAPRHRANAPTPSQSPLCLMAPPPPTVHNHVRPTPYHHSPHANMPHGHAAQHKTGRTP